MRRSLSLWIVALVAVCFLASGSQARGQEPQPPFSVLMFYDGSAIFGEGRTEALAGFSEDPDYLPVQETNDPAVFENAMLASRDQHNYHVFVAITSDGVTAESWSELANDPASDFNFAATYIDPADGTITLRIINRMRIPDGTPPPDGAPIGFFPYVEDITHEFLDGSLAASTGPNVVAVTPVPVDEPPGGGSGSGGNSTYFDRFRDWLRGEIDKARENVADFLEDLAEFVDRLPPEAKAKVKVEAEVNVAFGKLKITIEVEDIPVSAVGEALRDLSKQLRPK